MARPFRERVVHSSMVRCSFAPAGIPAREMEHVALTFDEVEAVRLADLMGLYQEAAAIRMGVSRQTFGRIVESARRKIADAIVNKKCLRIEGGEVASKAKDARGPTIAVPARRMGDEAQFERCRSFTVYSLDGGRKIAREGKIDAKARSASRVAAALGRMGVTHLIAGTIDQREMRLFRAHGIEVVGCDSGKAREAAERVLRGKRTGSKLHAPEMGALRKRRGG